MNVAAPAIQWLPRLTAEGPEQDPTILLTGTARIGGVAFEVSALHMREGFRVPDYREGIPLRLYDEKLDEMIDDVEDLVGSLGL